MTFDELSEFLETDISEKQGLMQDHATTKLEIIGPNSLTEKKTIPWYIRFLKEFTGLFNMLLWVGSALCFISYGLDTTDASSLYLGILLIIVVILTGCFSYYQSSKSVALMAQFKNFIPPRALVIRDGNESSIEAAKLVPGDLVRVKGGENIPADIRIIECHEMKVNNASLTGESDDLLRKVESTSDNPLETANLAFFGTSCTFGNGLGVVIDTGDRTVIGQIASLVQHAEVAETTLSIEVHRFIKIISCVAVTFGVAFFIIGVALGFEVISYLVFGIGIIIANVPEGLLATMTVSLGLSAMRMAKKKVLVKNLQAIDTLGSTTCICSDKTGTLTQNVMTVSTMWYSGDLHDASINYSLVLNGIEEKTDYDINDETCKELIKTVTLGTKAFFEYTPTEEAIKRKIGKILKKNPKRLTKEEFNENKLNGEELLREEENSKPYSLRHTEGDASESGLIKFIQPINDITDVRNKYPIHSYKIKEENGEETTVNCEIPFNSFKKYNLIIRDLSVDKSGDSFMLIMKGAPERIWGRCNKILVHGESRDINDYWNSKFEEANATLGKNGERVLAFARIYLKAKEYDRDKQFVMKEEEKNYPMEGLTFIGLVALNDPPRFYVDQSVDKCRRAGIKVIMVTGDQPVTAAAIAKKVNIITPESKVNVDLVEQGMDPEQAMEECDAIVIHGDELARRNASQDNLDEDDPEKGRFLMNWISKDEVVFARTTPAQKLLIVDACQRAGHVVTVTGDGVNDSPAIKKANIGVAMGSGSDVAKNAADMIILDDDFSTIVKGIEEGRLVFDNLKKSIAYTLSSRVPEMSPFIMYVILGLPLALSTILIVCVDMGTDMIPSISFAYENPENDIMFRNPRSQKRDHLINLKMVSFSYLQTGFMQALAGFFTFFVVLNDYGFKPGVLFGIEKHTGQVPNSGDVYNALDSSGRKGNTNVSGSKITIEWTKSLHDDIDLRLFYWELDPAESWSQCRFGSGSPRWWTTNLVSGKSICYKSDALKYAQSAYFVSIVTVQMADLLICKTKNLSLLQQGMKNNLANFGLCFELTLVSILCYVPYINIALSTRMIATPHFSCMAMPFFIVIFFYDEARKYFVRLGIDPVSRHSTGWVAQNTYY